LAFIQNEDNRTANESTIVENFKSMEASSKELFRLLDDMTQEAKHHN